MNAWIKDTLANLKADLARAHKSLTLRFNAVMAVLLYYGPDLINELAQTLPQLQSYLPENVYKALTALLIVGNMIVRFRTTCALRDK